MYKLFILSLIVICTSVFFCNNIFANNLEGIYEGAPSEKVIIKALSDDLYSITIISDSSPQCNLENAKLIINKDGLPFDPDVTNYSDIFTEHKYNLKDIPVILETSPGEFINDNDKLYIIYTNQITDEDRFNKEIINLNYTGNLKNDCYDFAYIGISGKDGRYIKPFIKK